MPATPEGRSMKNIWYLNIAAFVEIDGFVDRPDKSGRLAICSSTPKACKFAPSVDPE